MLLGLLLYPVAGLVLLPLPHWLIAGAVLVSPLLVPAAVPVAGLRVHAAEGRFAPCLLPPGAPCGDGSVLLAAACAACRSTGPAPAR